MDNEKSLRKRWAAYRPSKVAWFWSCIACALATVFIGFSWGGWTTGGAAADSAQKAARDAEAALAATICVSRFENAPNATAELATLKKTSFWERSDFIRNGNWLKLSGVKDTIPGAATLCADRLINAQSTPATSTSTD
jgi:hypothetical protein